MALIKHGIVTYVIDVYESDVRDAIAFEALEKHGLLHEGKPIKGVTTKVLFDGRRGGGTYTVHITRDIAASGQMQLAAPLGAARNG
jgi:hypothetical protein